MPEEQTPDQEPRTVPTDYNLMTPEQQQEHTAGAPYQSTVPKTIIENSDDAYSIAHEEKPYRDMASDINKNIEAKNSTEIIENLKQQAEIAAQTERERLEQSARAFAAKISFIIKLNAENDNTAVNLEGLDQKQINKIVAIFGVDFSKMQPTGWKNYAPSRIPNIIYSFVNDGKQNPSDSHFQKNPNFYQQLITGEPLEVKPE